jgi:hypothetical protein
MSLTLKKFHPMVYRGSPFMNLVRTAILGFTPDNQSNIPLENIIKLMTVTYHVIDLLLQDEPLTALDNWFLST